MLLRVVAVSLLFVLFAIIHSLSAGAALRTWSMRFLSERVAQGWYRILYNALACILLMPAIIAFVILPDARIIDASGYLFWVLRSVQLLSAIGVILTLVSTDLLRFLGIRQVLVYLTDQSVPFESELLKTDGIYSWSRHPLYVFSIIFLWASPNLTANDLALNICASVYYYLGSLVEERRLLAKYGEAYQHYRSKVGWLTPRFRKT